MERPKWDAIGLAYAVRGVKTALISQRNLKIHIAAGIIVAFAAVMLSTSAFENLVLTLTIAVVIITELVNTAIEAVVDLICIDVLEKNLNKSRINDNARVAKDVAAGAVLVAAIMSVIAGTIIFLPKIIEKFVI